MEFLFFLGGFIPENRSKTRQVLCASMETKAPEKIVANDLYVRVDDKVFRLSRAALPKTCILHGLDPTTGTSKSNALELDRTLDYFQIVLNYLHSNVFFVPEKLSFHLAISECDYFGVFCQDPDNYIAQWTHIRTHVVLSTTTGQYPRDHLFASCCEDALWTRETDDAYRAMGGRWTQHGKCLQEKHPNIKEPLQALEIFVGFLMQYSWHIQCPMSYSSPKDVRIELVR